MTADYDGPIPVLDIASRRRRRVTLVLVTPLVLLVLFLGVFVGLVTDGWERMRFCVWLTREAYRRTWSGPVPSEAT